MISGPVPPLAYGLVAGRPLFLDLVEDSYFVLDPVESDSLPHREADIVASDRPGTPLPPAVLTPPTGAQRSVLEEQPRTRLSPAVAEVWTGLLKVRRDLARRPLAGLLAAEQQRNRTRRPRRRKQQADTTGPDLTAEEARRFAAARVWVPAEPHCLTDSLALLRWLVRRRLSAELVFGARLDPFAAHCWLEDGPWLLNDHLDTVQPFTPVLRLRC